MPGRGTHNSRLQQISVAALNVSLLGGLVARWSYRFGLHSAARVRWDDRGRRQTYELPSDLLALAERTSRDQDKPVEVIEKSK